MSVNGIPSPSGPDGTSPEAPYGSPEYPFDSREERDAAIRQWGVERLPVPEIARRAGVSTRRVGQIRSQQRSRIWLEDRAELRATIAAQAAAITDRMIEIALSPGAPIVKTLGGGEGGSVLAYVTEPGDSNRVARDMSGPIAAAKVAVYAGRSLSTLFGLDAPSKTEVGGSVTYEIVGIDPKDLT